METPETAADMAARDAPLRSVRRAIMGSSRIYADCCGDTNYTARRPAPPEWRPRMRSIDPLRSDPPEVSIHPLDGAHECRALGIETLRLVARNSPWPMPASGIRSPLIIPAQTAARPCSGRRRRSGDTAARRWLCASAAPTPDAETGMTVTRDPLLRGRGNALRHAYHSAGATGISIRKHRLSLVQDSRRGLFREGAPQLATFIGGYNTHEIQIAFACSISDILNRHARRRSCYSSQASR